MWPPPISKMAPFSLVLLLWVRTATRGTTHSGFMSARRSGGMTVSVMRLAAMGGNDVADDVVFGALLGEGLGEADHGQLSSRVVGLAEVSEQAGGGGGVDDPAVLLLAEVRPGGASALVAPLDVNLEDEVPVRVLDVLEAHVTQDAGIVDQDIDATEALDGSLNDLVAVLHAVVVGHGLAAGGFDLVDDDIGGLRTRPG